MIQSMDCSQGFCINKRVDYNETFSSVYKKDSLRVAMVLVAHYDLRQMYVKIAFLYGELDESS